MTLAYYNENDPFAAAWLRNLIAARLIADGDVDERDIRDVRPDDIAGYTQCHFFAGIGVWSYALRLAGWPDDRPVWTGSCPCQPFSAAGRRDGFDDERHLWPHWHHLIWQRRPVVVFGEQVASKDGWPWIDLVQSDMEGTGYAFGAAVAPVAGFGAPHGRHRLWFVADTQGERNNGALQSSEREEISRSVATGRVSDVGGTDDARLEGWSLPRRERAGQRVARPTDSDVVGAVADMRSEGRQQVGSQPGGRGKGSRAQRLDERSAYGGAVHGPWRDAEWLWCRDEKRRPVEPGTLPLVDGASSRVGRLRAYGNAISPWPAAEFIAAYLEARGEDAVTLMDMLE